MLRKYSAIIVFTTAMILLVIFSLIVKWWLSQEQWALEGVVVVDWLHDLGRYIMTEISSGQKGFFLLGWLFPILYSALILTVVNIVFIALLILIRRWVSIKHWHYAYKDREKVQTALVSYLYGEGEITFKQMQKLNRRILVQEMVGLKQQIIGAKAESLQQLFFDLKLDGFVLRQIKKARWYNKIMYIDAAQWMQVQNASMVIEPYQYVENPYLRNVAQVACVNLDTGHSFAFLNILEYPIPVWHQITLYKTMVRNSLPLPDFYSFLHSENVSVVLFALNMIRLFSQQGAEEDIIGLVTHNDPAVRRNALRVVRDLKIYQAIPIVKQNFLGETLRVQIGMIQALSLDKPLETFEFYKNIWVDTPRRLQAEILKHVSPGLKSMLIEEIVPVRAEEN